MDELMQDIAGIVAASERRADYVTAAWIQNAALIVAMGVRTVLTPGGMQHMGPLPARVTALSEAERELLVAQTAEATRLLLTRALEAKH